ncbi:hypothetical protein C2845_PM17G09840 [Panicum miliaceum]|uniref:RRM domain-containing protein n=1 Tax=Panicum miliaceum TaxID=4540 RepID=A0A3L6Q2E1_PANMI|nr:hypothetical protein C2845_PM17G09840 [Panicum miliaceum]
MKNKSTASPKTPLSEPPTDQVKKRPCLTLPCSSQHQQQLQGTSTRGPQAQKRQRGQVVISSMDNSTVDLLSYLQVRDPKAVRLLEEKNREIWEAPCEDGVEECVTALAMLLPVVEEKISAPVTGVVEGISTKRSCYHVTVMLQLSGSLRTAWLLLKNMGKISVGCLPFSVQSEYFTEFFSAEFGLLGKAILIGLKRGSQIQLESFIFVEFEREECVINARYQMLGRRMDAKDAIVRPYLPAELQRNTSLRQFIHHRTKANHNMLDGELCEKHIIHKWCPCQFSASHLGF